MAINQICIQCPSFFKFELPFKNKKNLRMTSISYTVVTHLKIQLRASLVAQWLRICLPMQGTRVRALVWEDPTCHGATRPVSYNLLSLRVWSPCSATREAATVRGPRTAMKRGPHLPQLEKALAQKRGPNTAKNK